MTTERVKLDYYALGKFDKSSLPEPNFFNSNKGISDRSNTLLERNALSLNSSNLENIRNNYRALHTVGESKKDTNDYLKPIPTYNTREKYGITGDMTNKETYHLTKSRYFSKDKISTLNSGFSVTKDQFINKKSLEMSNSAFPILNTSEKSEVKNNNLYFDKTNKEMIRYPKGFWAFSSDKMSRTKISDEAPNWFHIVNDKKLKDWNEALAKNEETISVFSRYNKWITVTPKNKNRKKALEKIKIQKMEETSKIMPNWMQIKISKDKIKEDNMRQSEYQSMRDNKKMVMLVDKETNNKKERKVKNEKSVFAIGDYRHNLPYTEETELHMSKVSQQPKQFFAWNDNTVFHPKYKRDISENKIKIK